MALNISVALNGNKKRDITFFAGDDMGLVLTVYALDGDVSPITPTNIRFVSGDADYPYGGAFTVPEAYIGRTSYRIVGEVDGLTTTLAYGILTTEAGWPWFSNGTTGGRAWGTKAENITILDDGQYFAGDEVEEALQELGQRVRSSETVQTVNVMTFGTKTGSAADAQLAVNSLGSGGVVFYPSGQYFHNAAVNILKSGVTIRGASKLGTEVLSTTVNQSVFVFGDGVGNYESGGVFDIAINISSAAKTDGAAIFANKWNDLVLSNIRIANHYHGIRLTNSVLVWADAIKIINPTATFGVGVLIDGTSGNDHYLSAVFVQTISGTQCRAGFEFTFSTGSWMDRCGALSTGIGLLIDPADGQIVQHMFMAMNAFDTCSSHGILLQNVGTGIINRIQSTQDWVATCALNGMTINVTNGDGFTFSQLRSYNNQQHGIQVLSGNGFCLLNGSRVSGNGGAAQGSYHGVIIAPNVINFKIKDSILGAFEGFSNIQGFGIVVSDGTSDGYEIIGNDVRGNFSGGILDGGTGTASIVRDNIGNNPGGAAAVVVGASPWTYRAGHTPETHYLRAGSVSSIDHGGLTIATTTPITIQLEPNETYTVTHSAPPTVIKRVH